jgi:hypothetical protein
MADATTAQELHWTALSPEERYRRVTWEGLLIIQRTDEFVWNNHGPDAWAQFSEGTRPAWAGPIGRKLVADHPEDFTPDIEGAVKLMGAYGAEVWGSGTRTHTRIYKDSDSEGRAVIIDHGCPQWRALAKEMRGVFPCHKACGKEMDSVVKAGLGEGFEVETVKGRPLGDDDCVWRVRRTSGS